MYDEALADRVRGLLADRADVTERTMFGGLAFLVDGRMAVAASGSGGLMVRVDPAQAAELLREPLTEPVEMRGSVMKGWLRVDLMPGDDDVPRWVAIGVDSLG